MNSARFSLKLILILGLCSVIIVSFFKGHGEAKHKSIIPEKSFVSILKELHLSNALFVIPKIRIQYMEGDTFRIYKEIIESHGYTKEAMDTTLQYYYIKKPKKLISIYDQILGEFTEMQSRLEIETLQPQKDIILNQWPGDEFFELLYTGESEKSKFELTLIPPGDFILKFTATVFPDDQSFNPCCTANLIYADTPDFKKKKNLPVLKYIKDGLPHEYRIQGELTGKVPVILKGSFYDYFSDPDYGKIHSRIENISFLYSGTIR